MMIPPSKPSTYSHGDDDDGHGPPKSAPSTYSDDYDDVHESHGILPSEPSSSLTILACITTKRQTFTDIILNLVLIEAKKGREREQRKMTTPKSTSASMQPNTSSLTTEATFLFKTVFNKTCVRSSDHTYAPSMIPNLSLLQYGIKMVFVRYSLPTFHLKNCVSNHI